MSLQVYKVGYPSRVLTNLRNRQDCLSVVLNSPMSKMIQDDVLNGGSLAQQLSFEHITLADTGDLVGGDGYLNGLANMDPDLSSAYPEVIGTALHFYNNNLAIATSSFPFAERDFHQASDDVFRKLDEGMDQQIRNQIETSMFSEFLTAGVVQTGPGTSYAMDTSSQANLLSDVEVLSSFAEARNWGEDRWIFANTELMHAAIPFSQFTSTDFNQAIDPVTGGGLKMFNGWKFAFSNNIASGSAVAVDLNKVACVVNPSKSRMQVIDTEKDALKSYLRAWVYFGYGVLGGPTTNGDASSTNAPREGVARITVS